MTNDETTARTTTIIPPNKTNNNIIRSWTPTTTRQLLLPRDGDDDASLSCYFCALDVLDHVMENYDSTATVASDNGNEHDHIHKEQHSFVRKLSLELQPWLSQLTPARTYGDVQVDEIMSLLPPSLLNNNVNATATTSRGDLTMFIPRQVRNQVDTFTERHPCLSHLISSVETTAQKELSLSYIGNGKVVFDFTLTSVQLAVYPGDGRSGYPRHWDCSNNTNTFSKEQTIVTTNGQRNNGTQRIITAIYYVTPNDWNETLDGGCLRIFRRPRPSSSSSSTTTTTTTIANDNNDDDDDDNYYDIIPYSNRMVVFRSDIVEHQVMPSLRRPRMAITIWLYGKKVMKKLKMKDDDNDDDITSAILPTTTTRSSKVAKPAAILPTTSSSSSSFAARGTSATLPLPLSVSPRKDRDDDKNATIFVSIASYRDSELGPTLRSLFATARYPTNVYCGVVLQWDETAAADQVIVDSLPQDQAWFATNVKILKLDARYARGPCYARALCQQLYDGETFVLQTDSHMRFRPNWDTYLIRQLSNCPNPSKSMLTTYPMGYTLPNTIPNDTTQGTLLVPWKFDASDGMLRQRGRLLADSDSSITRTDNIRCYLYAAGFNFSLASTVITHVPYDGKLQYLFFGEELSMAVRLFTHGYDLYAPPETVVYHLWSRSHRPTPAQERMTNETRRRREMMRNQARQVVLQQLRGEEGGGVRGLGTERTAQEFAAALGVNFQEQSIDPEASLGGLQEDDFANDSSSLAPDSLEGQMASLDAKTKARIASFLSAMTL